MLLIHMKSVIYNIVCIIYCHNRTSSRTMWGGSRQAWRVETIRAGDTAQISQKLKKSKVRVTKYKVRQV